MQVRDIIGLHEVLLRFLAGEELGGDGGAVFMGQGAGPAGLASGVERRAVGLFRKLGYLPALPIATNELRN